jgi:hypothetical protein
MKKDSIIKKSSSLPQEKKNMHTFQLYLQRSTNQKSNRRVQKLYISKNPPPRPWPPPLSSFSVVASPLSIAQKKKP